MSGVAGRGAVVACALAGVLGVWGLAEARVGDPAPAFNGGNPVFVPPDSSDPNSFATLGAVAAQRDRKLVVAGTVASATSRCAGCERPVTWVIQRYLPDGQLDPAFGTGGVVKVEMEPMTFVTAIAVRPSDERILIGGSSGWRQDLGAAFVRLNPDGSLDSSFAGTGRLYLTRPELSIRESGTMALDSSGNAYLAVSGEDTDPCCSHQGAIASVTSDGVPNGWAPGGILLPDTQQVGDQRVTFNSVAVSGEKVFYAGNLEDPRGPGHALLGAVRRSGGVPAGSFGSSGLLKAPGAHLTGMLLGSDGKLKVTGSGGGATLIASFDTSGADPTDRSFGRRGRVLVGGDELNSPGVGWAITELGDRLFVSAAARVPDDSGGSRSAASLVGVDAATGALDTRLGPQGFRVYDFGDGFMRAIAGVGRQVALAGNDRDQGVLAVVEGRPRPGEIRARARQRRLRDERARVRVAGRLLRPSGVTESEGCRGAVTARFTRSGRVVRRERTRVSPRCRFSFTETFGPRRAPARVALRFLGNAAVGPAVLRKKL